MKTYDEIVSEVNDVHPCSDKEAAMLYAEQFKPQWIPVDEFIPESNKHYFCLIKATSGNFIKCVCVYTKGWDLEVDFDDVDDDRFNYNDEKEQIFMKKGWYEECEQDGHMYDNVYFKRTPIFILNIELP